MKYATGVNPSNKYRIIGDSELYSTKYKGVTSKLTTNSYLKATSTSRPPSYKDCILVFGDWLDCQLVDLSANMPDSQACGLPATRSVSQPDKLIQSVIRAGGPTGRQAVGQLVSQPARHPSNQSVKQSISHSAS